MDTGYGYHLPLPKERFEVIYAKYHSFLDASTDVTKPSVKVFDPMPKKILDELDVVRELSKVLQEKRDSYVQQVAEQKAGKTKNTQEEIEDNEKSNTKEKELVIGNEELEKGNEELENGKKKNEKDELNV